MKWNYYETEKYSADFIKNNLHIFFCFCIILTYLKNFYSSFAVFLFSFVGIVTYFEISILRLKYDGSIKENNCACI